MALKIRLARGGSKKRPYYRIVVAEASSPRDGRFVERLGSYNPMVPKDHAERLTLDNERAMYWISKGAKPTERVEKMMAGLGLIPAPVLREQPKKSAPGKKRVEREEQAAASIAEAKAAEEAAVEAPPAEAPPAEEVATEEVAVEEAAVEDSAPEEVATEDSAPEEAAVEESAPEDSPAEKS
jgi:small subunit ribosomal protein S16